MHPLRLQWQHWITSGRGCATLTAGPEPDANRPQEPCQVLNPEPETISTLRPQALVACSLDFCCLSCKIEVNRRLSGSRTSRLPGLSPEPIRRLPERSLPGSVASTLCKHPNRVSKGLQLVPGYSSVVIAISKVRSFLNTLGKPVHLLGTARGSAEKNLLGICPALYSSFQKQKQQLHLQVLQLAKAMEAQDYATASKVQQEPTAPAVMK